MDLWQELRNAPLVQHAIISHKGRKQAGNPCVRNFSTGWVVLGAFRFPVWKTQAVLIIHRLPKRTFSSRLKSPRNPTVSREVLVRTRTCSEGGKRGVAAPTGQPLRRCFHEWPVWGHTVRTWVFLLGMSLFKMPQKCRAGCCLGSGTLGVPKVLVSLPTQAGVQGE